MVTLMPCRRPTCSLRLAAPYCTAGLGSASLAAATSLTSRSPSSPCHLCGSASGWHGAAAAPLAWRRAAPTPPLLVSAESRPCRHSLRPASVLLLVEALKPPTGRGEGRPEGNATPCSPFVHDSTTPPRLLEFTRTPRRLNLA
ncbi:hypothetical protein ZWY2020_012617 [Hordeum vulgare]|nr:hypothetical protein ZWY2020_012617 [Hordeum vulgare]